MKIVRFNNHDFQMIGDVNVAASEFQVTILKQKNTIESIVNNINKTSSILVFEDDELVASYNNFNELFVVALYKNQVVNDSVADVVSIELRCTDVDAQIAALEAEIASLKEAQQTHAASIDSLTNGYQDAVETQEMINEAIADLGAETSVLSNSIDELHYHTSDISSTMTEISTDTSTLSSAIEDLGVVTASLQENDEAINAAIEDIGQSVTEQEKRQVLMDILSKLCE